MTQQWMAVLHALPGQNEVVALLPLAALTGLLQGNPPLPQTHEGIERLGQMVDPAAQLSDREGQGQQARGSPKQQRRRLEIPAGAIQQVRGRAAERVAMLGQELLMLQLERIH